MPAKSVFISHATRDDAQVKELRHNLEFLDVLVWTDSENLTAGGAGWLQWWLQDGWYALRLRLSCHNYGMSVRTTIDLPDDLYAILRRRAAAESTSIRSLITDAVRTSIQPRTGRRVTGPLVGKRGDKPAPGSPDRENPYDVLFA